MEVRQMASGPRQGAKRPVVAPTSARTASAAAATRHAPADPPAKAPEPISRGDGARQRVRRAGASKATLYRRWPTVGALLIDAMDATFQPFPVPDSGRVETDLAQLLAAFVTVLEQTRFPRLLAAFIDAAERDPTLAALHADLTRRRREPLLIVLNRARDRGQVPPDLDPEITTDLLAGPFFYRRFIAHRPIPPDLVHDVIANVLTTRAPEAANGHTTDRSTAAGTSAGPTRRMHRRSSR